MAYELYLNKNNPSTRWAVFSGTVLILNVLFPAKTMHQIMRFGVFVKENHHMGIEVGWGWGKHTKVVKDAIVQIN